MWLGTKGGLPGTRLATPLDLDSTPKILGIQNALEI
jgi:hypothetical protein